MSRNYPNLKTLLTEDFKTKKLISNNYHVYLIKLLLQRQIKLPLTKIATQKCGKTSVL